MFHGFKQHTNRSWPLLHTFRTCHCLPHACPCLHTTAYTPRLPVPAAQDRLCLCTAVAPFHTPLPPHGTVHYTRCPAHAIYACTHTLPPHPQAARILRLDCQVGLIFPAGPWRMNSAAADTALSRHHILTDLYAVALRLSRHPRLLPHNACPTAGTRREDAAAQTKRPFWQRLQTTTPWPLDQCSSRRWRDIAVLRTRFYDISGVHGIVFLKACVPHRANCCRDNASSATTCLPAPCRAALADTDAAATY